MDQVSNNWKSKYFRKTATTFQELRERTIDVLETIEYSDHFARFKQIKLYRIKTELDACVNKLKNLASDHWSDVVTKAETSITNPNFALDLYLSFDRYFER